MSLINKCTGFLGPTLKLGYCCPWVLDPVSEWDTAAPGFWTLLVWDTAAPGFWTLLVWVLDPVKVGSRPKQMKCRIASGALGEDRQKCHTEIPYSLRGVRQKQIKIRYRDVV